MNNKLSSYDKELNNNISLMKLIASFMVIVSHSFSLANINSNQTYVKFFVYFFFFISGYYSMKKLLFKEDNIKFLVSRFKKLLPILIETTILVVFIIGPFLTNLPLKQYLVNKETYMYLLVILMIRIHSLPGVFENNPCGNEVNGSLWTLPFQCICYFVAVIVNKILKLIKNKYVYIILLNVLLLIGDFIIPFVFKSRIQFIISNGYSTIVMFVIGMEYYYFRDKITLNWKYAILLFIISLVLLYLGIENIFYYLFYPYFLCILLFVKQIKRNLNYLGSLSYPVYLLGWPIQQALISLCNGKINPIANALTSFIICIIISSCILFINKLVLKNKRA